MSLLIVASLANFLIVWAAIAIVSALGGALTRLAGSKITATIRHAAHVVEEPSDAVFARLIHAPEAFPLVIIATVPMPFAVLVTLAAIPRLIPCAASVDAATGRLQCIELG